MKEKEEEEKEKEQEEDEESTSIAILLLTFPIHWAMRICLISARLDLTRLV